MRREYEKTVGLGIRQWLDEPGIQVTEHGGVGADAQRKSEDRHQGESWILGQHSHAIAQVLPKRLHQLLPCLAILLALLISAPTAYEEPHFCLSPLLEGLT